LEIAIETRDYRDLPLAKRLATDYTDFHGLNTNTFIKTGIEKIRENLCNPWQEKLSRRLNYLFCLAILKVFTGQLSTTSSFINCIPIFSKIFREAIFSTCARPTIVFKRS
jgi:hypothetical protein